MSKVIDLLTDTFLFSGIPREQIEQMLPSLSPELLDFSRGEQIFGEEEHEKKVGFLISGRCEVGRGTRGSSFVSINVLKPTDSFGIISVFSKKKEFPTQIYAEVISQILFLSAKGIRELSARDPRISLNIIGFLTDRIEFLNRRIKTFSESSVSARLASHLLSEMKKTGNDAFRFNCSKCAEAINAGRASVYRALDFLEQRKYIDREGQFIKILNPNGIKEITK